MIRKPSFGTIGLVYGKELRETLRDRRTIMVMVLFPMVVYPLMSLLLAQVMASKASKNAAYASRVAVATAGGDATGLRQAIAHASGDFALQATGNATDVELGRLDALIVVEPSVEPPPPSHAPAAPAATPVSVVYDETREPSNHARERIDRLLAGKLSPQCHVVYAVHDRSVAPAAKVGGYLLSKVLPLVVVIMVMLGAFYPAIDITAGERERGTLETILASPVDRFDLMAGKVLAVATLAAVTGMLNLVSISLTMLEGIRLMGGASDALRIPWFRTIAALTMVVPSAFLFASVMVAVGAMARGFKEAQNLLTPIYFLSITPALIAALGEYEMTGVALVIPGVNVTLLARAIVLGNARVGPALAVIASTLFYGGLALALAARLYDSERLLYADDQRLGLRDWLRSLLFGARAPATAAAASSAPAPTPTSAAHRVTAGDSLMLFGTACVLLFFVFFPLQSRHLELGLVVSEWGGMLGLVVIYARFTQQRLSAVLVLARPSGRALLGAALCGLSAWMVIGLMAEWIAPAPRELIERLRHQVAPPGGRGVVATLLLMAVTPAICEEALFRGPILRGFTTRLSPVAAAAVTGALFGLFHFDLWRFLPTALLGLMLSLIALRARSIVPSMLAHAVNNGCLVTLAQLGVDEKMTTLGAAPQVALFAASSLVLAAGGFLVGTDRTTGSRPGESPVQM